MKRVSMLFDMTREELQKVYDESKSFNELGKKTNTSDYKTMKTILINNGINISRLESPAYLKNNLLGKTFNRLLVIEYDEEKSKEGHGIYWKCKCSCEDGKIISASTSDLIHGRVVSCGCLRKENSRNALKKYNIYDLSKDYGVGFTTNTNKPFYFDKADFDKIKEFAWRETKHGYVEARNNKKFIFLHRLIMPCDNELEIDHINHNKLDNRKSNLRICTRQENVWNTHKRPNKESGHVGVSKTKSGKWSSRIKKDGKTLYLGTFDNIEDAIKVREEAEIKIRGEFRYKEE